MSPEQFQVMRYTNIIPISHSSQMSHTFRCLLQNLMRYQSPRCKQEGSITSEQESKCQDVNVAYLSCFIIPTTFKDQKIVTSMLRTSQEPSSTPGSDDAFKTQTKNKHVEIASDKGVQVPCLESADVKTTSNPKRKQHLSRKWLFEQILF